RRSTEEVRSLVLAAARELFAERGFSGTTTREIAERAGVEETILFRNYGTKERLFQQAVAHPIEDFMNGYVERWPVPTVADLDPEQMLRTFVESRYDLAESNRDLLLAAIPD